MFLDRDGTINRHIGYLDWPEQIELLPGVGAAIRRLNRAGVLAVVVTNQAVIACGQCTTADLEQIHARLKEQLGQHGAYLDAIYHCPHHSDRGQPGELAELKIVCRCRKPEPGMIEAALRDLPIDPNQCAVVGNTEREVGLVHNNHCRAIGSPQPNGRCPLTSPLRHSPRQTGCPPQQDVKNPGVLRKYSCSPKNGVHFIPNSGNCLVKYERPEALDRDRQKMPIIAGAE